MMKRYPIAPTTESELLERSHALAGLTLGEIAESFGICVPHESVRAKGFAGILLEQVLGATATSKPEPDFQLIGVELKSLPINALGKPRESTYVCTVPLIDNHDIRWETSTVKRKLTRVLWVPILVETDAPIADRRIAMPLLWSASIDEEAALRHDWEELMDMVVMGELNRVSAHHGTWLQIRPKAADSRARGRSTNADGTPGVALPRGFYLRTSFTSKILRQHYALP
jgi:DNA mismatch repair protein MutH